MFNTDTLVGIIGWIGSGLLILAYGLLSLKRIASSSWLFHTMNLLGGLFLMVNTMYHGSYAASFVNIFWSIIAIGALIKLVLKKS